MSNSIAEARQACACEQAQRPAPTHAQQRLIDTIRAYGGADEGGAEYWPAVNDWVRDAGRTKALALRNINRTVEALIRDGYVTLGDDGCFRIPEGR